MNWKWLILIAASCLLGQAAAAPCAEPPGPIAARVAELIERLNDDRFDVRADAVSQLGKLRTDPATAAEVGRLIDARLTDSKLPLDVREALRPYSAAPVMSVNVPGVTEKRPADGAVAAVNGEPIGDAEWNELFAALNSTMFDERDRAERRLRHLAASTATCGPVLERMLKLVEGPTPTVDAARRWQSVWTTAWGTWLADGENPWHPGTPDGRRLDATIGLVASDQPVNDVPPWLRVQARAERQLLLWLADERSTAATAAALDKYQTTRELSIDAEFRVASIAAWNRPAMSAEYWREGRHLAVQHLLIGIPNQPAGAERPSLFDRCDEETAHCVSGNSLAPGDHPVGVFFPHPRSLEMQAQFHLVNLPTPRRRLAYEFVFPVSEKTDAEVDAISDRRRGPITRRTVDYLLKQNRPLDPLEIDMLEYLEPAEAARLIEPYLLAIDDIPYDSGSPQPFGNGSLHGWLCYAATRLAEPAAGKGIAAAIDAKRILPPTDSKPYRIDWVAAFYLAEAAPWSGVDAWLAKHVDRTEPIHIHEPDAADVGASAAAALLRRNGIDPIAYGLERHLFDELADLENPAYRFVKPEGREKVKAWWAENRDALPGDKSP